MRTLDYLTHLDPHRFELPATGGARGPGSGPTRMDAVVTAGTGGYEKLEYREVPVPAPRPGEVLLKVLAAGMNNTEINTRLGWYSASVHDGTEQLSAAAPESNVADGGWNAPTPFPFIQGTDCCGEVTAHGEGVSGPAIGTRVLVRPCMRVSGFDSPENIWMGSDFDGAFAEYVCVPAAEVFEVACSWSAVELATLPCAYGTAENMLLRAGTSAADRVLVTGASGGVGSATVQLAKARGAHVTAVVGAAKMEAVAALGADRVIPRGADIVEHIGAQGVDVVVDNVGGEGFPRALAAIARGGRYVTSGAIGGPVVSLDMRELYLKDVRLIGCTAWDEPTFPNLVRYVETGAIKPVVAGTYQLREIAAAQREFMLKRHVGKFVLVPPGAEERA